MLLIASTEERDGRVAGLVRRDREPLTVCVRRGVTEPELFGELCLLEGVFVEARPTPTQRPHQRLVEEVLDHHGRVTPGDGRDGVAGPVATATLHLAPPPQRLPHP